jgi:phage baseplate assembly protein W
MDLRFPFQLDARGRTAQAGEDAHLRDLIEQVLFTAPGERVNRPDFGSGLLQLVFAPQSDELVATVQYLVRGALQQWLGDRIEVEGVEVQSEDGRLEVTVRYLVLKTQERQVAQMSRRV